MFPGSALSRKFGTAAHDSPGLSQKASAAFRTFVSAGVVQVPHLELDALTAARKAKLLGTGVKARADEQDGVACIPAIVRE